MQSSYSQNRSSLHLLFLLLLLLLFISSSDCKRSVEDISVTATPPVLPLSYQTARAILKPGTRARLSSLQQHLSICAGETSVTVIDDDATAFLPLLIRCDTGPLSGTETWMSIDSIVAVSREVLSGPIDEDKTSTEKIQKFNKFSTQMNKDEIINGTPEKSKEKEKIKDKNDEREKVKEKIDDEEKVNEKNISLKSKEPYMEKEPFDEKLPSLFLMSIITVVCLVVPKM